MRLRVLRFALVLSLLAAAARAQSVRWDPPGGSLPVGQSTSLQLVCDDCEAKDTPTPPKVDGLALEYEGSSSSMSWINGSFSHSVTYNYTALLSRDQSVDIPSFEVETNKGRLRVAAVHFNTTGATVGGGEPLDTAANAALEATPGSVWAGEIIDLNYRIEVGRSYYPNFGNGTFDWNPDPLIAEDWSQPAQLDLNSGTEPQTGLTYHTRAIARKPGQISLNPITQLVNLSVGMSGLGFFQQRQYQKFSVTSTVPTLTVLPLPPAPAGYTGAVGDFKLTSKIVPTTTPVGEPITWTLELKGTGNWPDIAGLPSREVSKDFQVVQPKAKRTAAANKLFDSTLTEDVVLVPTRPGTYTLEPVTFTYFDPKDGSYRTVTAAGATVTISAPANAPGQAPEAGGAATPQVGSPALAAVAPPATPPPPPALPRDAIPESGPALTPWSSDQLAILLATPFALLLVLWLWLAFRRARRTDPRRRRREAHARLAATLDQLRRNPPGPGAGAVLLAAWQRDAAVLLGVPHAAPSAAQLGDAAAWAALWSEAERALYGPEAALPADWVSRATAALATRPAPPFPPQEVFLPRNLLPWCAALALAAVLGSFASASADDSGAPANPSAAYRRGDFASAESGWRAALAREPADWVAEHNLSLALAQQNRWDEAAAHAIAAFVQAPGDPAVRWQFALACDKAGFVPAPLAQFLPPGAVPSLAQLASPATWQLALIAAAWLAATALALLLARGFRPPGTPAVGRRWEMGTALTVLGFAAMLTVVSLLGWRAYGPAADRQAVVTWRDATLCSIPTEADTSQKTVPLAPGSVALADRSFLGWTRLSFENGQTGWVRSEELVGLWK